MDVIDGRPETCTDRDGSAVREDHSARGGYETRRTRDKGRGIPEAFLDDSGLIMYEPVSTSQQGLVFGLTNQMR